MKRAFRPLLLAALCWLLVALVPTTRNGLGRAAHDAFASQDEAEISAVFDTEAMRRFPDDRRVQLDALAMATAGFSFDPDKKQNRRGIEALGAKLGDDSVAITLLLGFRLDTLKQNRNQGPLTISVPTGTLPSKKPADVSPRADWDSFLTLARRGQKLEPRNSFFSWMILYALFAPRRDDEARAELKRASHLSQYDDHARDIVLNHVAVTRLMNGSPLSALEGFEAIDLSTPWSILGGFRQTTRWAVESAIADRASGNHPRALDTAFEILQMGRVMRRGSYNIIGVLTASAIEQMPLRQLLSPASARKKYVAMPTGTRNRRVYLQQDSFYYYAQNHGRNDIMRFILRESPELSKWHKLGPINILGFNDWTGNKMAQTVTLIAQSKAEAMILRALTWILGLGAFFTLFSRRLRDDSGAAVSGFWRGAVAVGVLLGAAMIFDALIALRGGDAPEAFATLLTRDSLVYYLDPQGLLSDSPGWVAPGWALALVLVAFGAAIGWQKRQVAPPIALKTRFKSAFEAPADGLSRFDFGWLGRLIVMATGWLLLFGAFGLLSSNFEAAQKSSGVGSAGLGNTLLGAAVLFSLLLHVWAWRRLPRRRATVRVTWRLISQSLLGAFVASSVLYALLAFAFLPLSLRFDRNFQSAMERGEVQIARGKIGTLRAAVMLR